MKLFRNPEIRKTLLLYVLLTVCAVIAASVTGSASALFVLGVCALFTGVYLVATYRRYERIASLSAQINRILHNEAQTLLDEYTEGELGILQNEIKKMTVRLREQQRSLLNDKKYLADSLADISHQIKTPLTAIHLLLSLLCEENLPEEQRKRYLHELLALLSRIEWLIATLLKISQLDTGTVQFRKESISLAHLIERATAPLLIPMELREQLLSVNAEGMFCGDTAWTAEAITNIVKNCMEHTPSGGRIEITASENALYSQIVVRDTGCGIDQKDLPHIFERFYKGENSDSKSFGIGLALAKMIVASQNGTVKAANHADCGAVFTIRFYKGTV